MMAVKKNNRIEKQSKHIMSHIMLFIFYFGGFGVTGQLVNVFPSESACRAAPFCKTEISQSSFCLHNTLY